MERRPSEWAEAQRDFRQHFERSPDVFAHVPVHWRVAAPAVPAGRGVPSLLGVAVTTGWALHHVAHGGALNGGPLVSIWPVDAPAGASAALIFEVDAMPEQAEGDGRLIGEFGLNGALCLALGDGRLLWPIYNPRRPAFNAARR